MLSTETDRPARRGTIKWARAEPLWGKFTDKEIARVLGCTIMAVYAHRRKHDIPAKEAPREWPDDLGLVEDSVIAQRLGVTRQAVQLARRNRGIPACPKRKPVSRAELARIVAELCTRCGMDDLAARANGRA